MKKKDLITIGRIDHVDLPEFELFELGCKIDTGAALSALHCHSVKVVEKEGVEHLHFKLLDKRHPQYQGKYYSTTNFRERNIRNSFGQQQSRYSIMTIATLFGRDIEIEITLADRDKMIYPCLLGRNLLKQGFLVDVRKTYLSTKFKKKSDL